MELFLAPESWPFVATALIVLLIAIIEGVAVVFGLSLTGWVDDLLPDSADGLGGLADSWLGWLHLGKVPLLALLLVFLTAFACLGFLANALVKALLGVYPPAWLSSLAAFFCALPVVRGFGKVAGHLIPGDETTALPLEHLVGRVGVVVSGTARFNNPAEARVKNAHGLNMYVRVEPESEGSEFATGTSVLLVRQVSGTRFIAITNPRPDIL